MKIFLGGQNRLHQQQFERRYPHIEFTFAAFDDTLSTWFREAAKADVVIVDQSRCSHAISSGFKRRGIKVVFVDGKREMRNAIERWSSGQGGAPYVCGWFGWVGGGW